jgi:hypothetical protein
MREAAEGAVGFVIAIGGLWLTLELLRWLDGTLA